MMNNQPSHSQETKFDWKGMLHHLWKVCINQWPWKLSCLVIAIFLWGVLIAQDDSLTREKTFEDVSISVSGASTLQRNGMIVVSGLDDLAGITMKAEVPQRYYDTVTAGNYNVRVDLSRITKTGEQSLPIEYTRTTYGLVTDFSVKEIDVVVESYVTRSRIPVKVRTLGEAPDGLYANANNVAIDPEYVTVSGPKSVVSSIVRCVVLYDMAALSGDAGLERTACGFVLENAQGEEVDMSLVTVMNNGVTLDSVVVEQNLYPQVEQQLSDLNLIVGDVAEGYRIKSVTMMPQSIVVAVRDTESFVSELAYLEGSVDVTGLTKSTTAVLPISRPADVISMNTDVVYVTVEIEKVEDAEGNT